jgi:hypothetical protein
MQDQYTGKAGTFITDPETGTRMPLEDYQAAQAAKNQADSEALPTRSDSKKSKTEEPN